LLPPNEGRPAPRVHAAEQDHAEGEEVKQIDKENPNNLTEEEHDILRNQKPRIVKTNLLDLNGNAFHEMIVCLIEADKITSSIEKNIRCKETKYLDWGLMADDLMNLRKAANGAYFWNEVRGLTGGCFYPRKEFLKLKLTNDSIDFDQHSTMR